MLTYKYLTLNSLLVCLVIAKHLRFGQQEDSHEFLRYVIDGMMKSCLSGVPEKYVLGQKWCLYLCHTIYEDFKCWELLCASNVFLPPRLDAYTKATTMVHQVFGGYYRSQGLCYKYAQVLQIWLI